MDRRTVTGQAWKAEQALWSPVGATAMEWLRNRGLTPATIREARLGAIVGLDKKTADVNIPYINPDGSVRFNRTRYLNPERRKYHTPKGAGLHIYNVAATRSPEIWITEGEFDSLILRQLGLPAVGVPGTNAFRRSWKYLFTYTEQVTIVADGDDAGIKAAQRVASMLGSFVDDMRIVELPPGFDVNDMYLRDPTGLKALVS